ncbi:Orct [Bugula neritina]|uniref:Orct n=1 Tax=Bugula neritina TaxID=10212 RepID=A0A7J7KB77_BUGNE|nr:Orct [Bugula neritina]
MKLDKVLEAIGGFGKYQKFQFFLAGLPTIVVGFHQLVAVFLNATPEFRCAHNSTDESFEFNLASLSYNFSAIESYDPCVDYSSSFGNQIVSEPCQKFVYSKEYFSKTIVTEWDLVCEENFKSTLSTMLYMAGSLIGNLVFGILSDVIGRKKAMVLAMVLLILFGFGAAFSPYYYLFAVLRMGVGGCATGLYMCLFVIAMELVGKQYRVYIGVAVRYFYTTGFVILTGIAYLSKDWFYTQIATTAPALLFLSYIWLVPESARWLLSKERTAEASEVVSRAARMNGVALPDDFSLEQDTSVSRASLSEVLKKGRTLFARALILCVTWASGCAGYYGLSLNSGNIGGNIYTNFLLSVVVEFVSYTVCLSINKLGRKKLCISGLLVAGSACIATVLVDHFVEDDAQLNGYHIALNVVGKFGLSISHCTIYVWAAELYPTTLRNSLLGLNATMGRIGQILAPLVNDIGNFVPEKYSKMLSPAIIGTSVILSGLLTFLLPETAGRKLPETIEEANVFPR